MDWKHVPLNDWISLAVGIIGFLSALAARRDRLPDWARKWLRRIGSARIMDAIERAAAITELSPDARRAQAVTYLQELTVRELGFPIPQSIANLLIEHAYQQWKRGSR
ncbi:MAG: hypothetical protein QHI38_13675 [Armatimonadota bacterium]|nr:hypothetical protein [Armatimonadota bacterium]